MSMPGSRQPKALPSMPIAGQAPVRREGQELAAVAVGVLRLRVGEQDASARAGSGTSANTALPCGSTT